MLQLLRIAEAEAWGCQNTSGWQQLHPEPDLILVAMRLKQAAALGQGVKAMQLSKYRFKRICASKIPRSG